MTKPAIYRICVQGHLSAEWSDWFGGLAIENQANGDAVLFGVLPDQAALHGVLRQICNLGLTLVSLKRIEIQPGEE